MKENKMRQIITRIAGMVSFVLPGLVFMQPNYLVAQTIPDTTLALLQELLALEEIEYDDEDQMEEIEAWLSNPLLINSASKKEWLKFTFLDATIAEAIIRFRDAYGPFSESSDLRAVPEVTDPIYALLAPFIYRDQPTSDPSRIKTDEPVGRNLDGFIRYRAGRRLESSRGYTSGAYAGSPWRSQLRAGFRLGTHISFNLLSDKDPGEPSMRIDPGEFNPPDYLSANLVLESTGRLRSVVVGDFKIHSGQGLLLWSSETLGRSSEQVRTEYRRSRGLKASTSASENSGFRGLGFEFVTRGSVGFTGFVSKRKLDATVDTTWIIPGAISLSNSGLHRTKLERDRRLNFSETVLGGIVEFTSGNHELSATGVYRTHSIPLVLGSGPDRVQFGTSGTSGSLSYAGALDNVLLFAEVAMDEKRHVAAKAGMQLVPSELFRTTLSVNVLPPSYYSRFGSIYRSYGSGVASEYSLFAGFSLKVSPTQTVHTIVESFLKPNATSQLSRPVRGSKARLESKWKSGSGIEWKTSIRGRWIPEASTISLHSRERLPTTVPSRLDSVRLEAVFPFNRNLFIKARADYAKYTAGTGPGQRGFAAYQELIWRISNRSEIFLRQALYSIGSYQARIFQFEADHRFVMRNVAYSGVGERFYALYRLNISDKMRASLKYARTHRQDVAFLGSGQDAIEGNRATDVSFQFEWYVR